MIWALLSSCLIVAIAATIARATLTLRGALSAEDAGLAVMLLLPEEEISRIDMLRAGMDTQEFLAETKTGPKLIRAQKTDGTWHVQERIQLRESGQ
jgi:hypothetical protein